MRPGRLVLRWWGAYLSSNLIITLVSYKRVASIHERSAREKISTDQVAHVLNDEVSRKYIQSLKRLVSFLLYLSFSPFHFKCQPN